MTDQVPQVIVDEVEEDIIDNDEMLLNHNQRLRHDIVTHLTTDSEGTRRIPLDTETLNIVKGMLKDTDSSIFTKRRVMVDELGAENDKRAADLIERVLQKSKRSDRDATDLSGTGPVIDESQLPEFDITEGAVSEVGDRVDLDQIQVEGRKIRKGESSQD